MVSPSRSPGAFWPPSSTALDGPPAGPGTVDIGFLETVVQRKFRIVSTTDAGHETSTAVVQVNQNGAFAINSWEVQ